MNEPHSRARISVAMCTYNGERYLQEQLDTIMAQTRPPLELVVCDDQSTDNTLEILELFAQKAPFPVHIFKNSTQLGSTQNFDKAIRLCQGDYIALSDQDDRWKPEKLALLGQLLDADPGAGMAFSNAILIDGNSQSVGGTLWESLLFGQKVQTLFATNAASVLLERPVVTGATLIFRRLLIQHFENIPPNWVHDGWITWMSTLWARSLFTPETLTEYRIHVAQQLGVGRASIPDRLGRIRRGQRTHHSKVAAEFEGLLQYVECSSLSMKDHWSAKLEGTIRFLKARANAPPTSAGRLLFIIRHLGHYKNASGLSWRSLLRDFLMGDEPTNKSLGTNSRR